MSPVIKKSALAASPLRLLEKVLYIALIILVAGDIAVAETPKRFRPVGGFELQSVKVATDVAWNSERTLVFAAAAEGVVEVDVTERRERVLVAGSGGPARYGEGPTQSIWGAFRVASEGDLLVVTAPIGALVWRRMSGPMYEAHFADARDFDLLGGRAFIVGVSGERARWGTLTPPATMWSLLLQGDRADVTPLQGGPEPKALLHCTMTLNSAVTRMPNGTVAAAPGVTPGVVLYDRHGRKIRSWKTDRLGYLDRCEVSEEQGMSMAGDARVRFQWLNRHETLDDMIGTDQGPLLIIRRPRKNGTSWRGILLPFSGKPSSLSIPVVSPSPYALLRASARGSRVALMISDFPRLRPETLKTKVVIAELSK